MQRRALLESTIPAVMGAALAPGLVHAGPAGRNAWTAVPPARALVLAAQEGRTRRPLVLEALHRKHGTTTM